MNGWVGKALALVLAVLISGLVPLRAVARPVGNEIILRACGKSISVLLAAVDDAKVLADESAVRIANRKLALAYYHCAQTSQAKSSRHLRETLLLRYAGALKASLPERISESEADQINEVIIPLQASPYDEISNDALQLYAEIEAAMPTQGDPDACNGSGFAKAMQQWQTDWNAYAAATRFTASQYQNLQSAEGTQTNIPTNISASWYNVLSNASNMAKNGAEAKAMDGVKNALRSEHDLLATADNDVSSLTQGQEAIHQSGMAQTDALASRALKDIEAVEQYSDDYTAAAHLGQTSQDDLKNIKSANLDYADATRGLSELPYCSK